jgi:hypothetical protein
MKEKIGMAICCVLMVLPSLAPADGRPDGHTLLTQRSKVVAMTEATEEAGPRFSPEDYVQTSFCLGYLSGLLDMTAIWEVTAGPRGVFCVPRGVLRAHAARIVVHYLHEHAAKLHEDGAALIILAMKEAFPCS